MVVVVEDVLVLVDELVDDEVDVDVDVEVDVVVLELVEDEEEDVDVVVLVLVDDEEDVDVLVLVLVVVDVEEDVEVEELVLDVDVLVDVDELDELVLLEVLVDVDVVDVLELVEEDDELLVDVVLDVVVVVGGTLRPEMLTRPQLHFEPVPGSVVSSLVHTAPALLSQLVHVPASTMLSALESAHVTWVVKSKVVKRQVPPIPPVQGPITLFPQGFVFCAYTSPQLSPSAS